VTTDPISSQPPEPQSVAPTSPSAPLDKVLPVTRASAAWVATGIALLLLVMLIVFILQNSTRVEVHYLGLAGSLPLGMALLIAAVGAGVAVAIAGGARVTQLHAGRFVAPDTLQFRCRTRARLLSIAVPVMDLRRANSQVGPRKPPQNCRDPRHVA
jgi:uncharacterized integral membrane protein